MSTRDTKTKVLPVAPEWIFIEKGPAISCWRCGQNEPMKIPRPAAEVYRFMDRFVKAHRGCLEAENTSHP